MVDFAIGYSGASDVAPQADGAARRPCLAQGRGAASDTAGPSAGARVFPPARDFSTPAPGAWRGVRGTRLANGARVRLRFAGPADGPLVAVMGGISANRIVADDGRTSGWWRGLVGPGRAIDLDRARVVGMDFVAGEGDAPLDLTPADQADLFARALTAAGAETLDAFVGASFGGMVALSFARQFPERLGRLALVCAAHRPSPLAQGWRSVQRRILAFALENGKPEEGVEIARALAMTTYRSGAEFDQRFACAEKADGGIEGYLAARGKAYAGEVSPARYITLSGAIDKHFERPEEIATPTLLIGFDTDMIVPVADLRDLAARLAGPCAFVELSSPYGHDAFLKEDAALAPHLKTFLNQRGEP